MRDREGGSEVRKHVIWNLPFGSLVSVPSRHVGRSQITGTQQLSVSTEACLKHAFGGAPEPPTAQPFGRGV